MAIKKKSTIKYRKVNGQKIPDYSGLGLKKAAAGARDVVKTGGKVIKKARKVITNTTGASTTPNRVGKTVRKVKSKINEIKKSSAKNQKAKRGGYDPMEYKRKSMEGYKKLGKVIVKNVKKAVTKKKK